MIDLSQINYIETPELISRVVAALQSATPFSLARWADSSNWIMTHGDSPVEQLVYRESFMRRQYFEEYKPHFLHGAASCDIFGCFRDDWTAKCLNESGIDFGGKLFIDPRCHTMVNDFPAWTEEVLMKPWRTLLVGNFMPAYAGWLKKHSKLDITDAVMARGWWEVALTMEAIKERKPQLVLASAGWFTSALIGAAKDAGAVAFSYGSVPERHIAGNNLPW